MLVSSDTGSRQKYNKIGHAGYTFTQYDNLYNSFSQLLVDGRRPSDAWREMGPASLADDPYPEVFQGQGDEQDRILEQNNPFVGLQGQPSVEQDQSVERQDISLEQHTPSVGQYNPFVEQDDPFAGHGDDEQSELSFSSAIGTPRDNLHSITHHRETTV